MKKIFSSILLLCAAPAVTAATISQDSYEYPGSEKPIELGDDILGNKGSFSITYDLVGVNLNDIVTNGGTFFSLAVEDEKGTEGSITIAYSSALGFYSTGLGGMQYDSDVPYIDVSTPFVFQYDSSNKTISFSYYHEYDSDTNPHDLTPLLSFEIGEDNIFERGIATGNFTITLPFGEADNIKTWSGAATADDIAAAKSIPEPATATLSLLALCGLAARRRRR